MVERFARGSKMLRVVMSIVLDERLDGHSQIPCGNPWIDAALHEPCRCCVSQNVRGNPAVFGSEFSVEDGGIECLGYALYGAPFVLDYGLTRDAKPVPATQVCQQSVW
jgi:hypothetical protein